jgi:ATP adenylyltransferase
VNDDRLWAPWRLQYVTGGGSDTLPKPPEPAAWQEGADRGCFLCRAAAQFDDSSSADRQLLVAGRDRHTLVMLNRFPYNNGHLMVAPFRHVAQLGDLTRDEHLECMEWLTRLTRLLGDRLKAEGFNIGLNLGRVGGAGLPGHVHWHLVPRWLGDSNYMSVVADTRVIPQSLEALWELLTDALNDASK